MVFATVEEYKLIQMSSGEIRIQQLSWEENKGQGLVLYTSSWLERKEHFPSEAEVSGRACHTGPLGWEVP